MNLEELVKSRPELSPLTGMRATIPYSEPSADDLAIFNRDFEVLAKQLDKAELGDSFRSAKPFYQHSFGVSRAHLDKTEHLFEGIKCTSTWGMRLFAPQDCGTINFAVTPVTSTLRVWDKDIALAAANNWGDILGTAAAPISPSSTADKKAVHAFHALLAYLPVSMLQSLYWEILGVPYAVPSVEAQSKGGNKTLPSIIPLVGPFLIISQSNYYIAGCFDKGDIANAETVRTSIAPFGLVFAEYGYLKEQIK